MCSFINVEKLLSLLCFSKFPDFIPCILFSSWSKDPRLRTLAAKSISSARSQRPSDRSGPSSLEKFIKSEECHILFVQRNCYAKWVNALQKLLFTNDSVIHSVYLMHECFSSQRFTFLISSAFVNFLNLSLRSNAVHIVPYKFIVVIVIIIKFNQCKSFAIDCYKVIPRNDRMFSFTPAFLEHVDHKSVSRHRQEDDRGLQDDPRKILPQHVRHIRPQDRVEVRKVSGSSIFWISIDRYLVI